MARKAAQTSAAPTTETQTDAQAGTEAATVGGGKKKAPRKAPKVLFEAAVDKIKTALGELLIPRYASVGEEFRKAIEDAQPFINTALGIVKGLPDTWKPTGKATRKRKVFVNGEFVKAKEKYLELFREKGFGAGPFKVLGVLPTAGEVKLVIGEGTQYVPQNQVEKVNVAVADEQAQ